MNYINIKLILLINIEMTFVLQVYVCKSAEGTHANKGNPYQNTSQSKSYQNTE